jgi:hypothetical protein
MNRAMKLVVAIVVGLALFFGAAGSQAQSGGGYDLTWHTIDNGGGTIGNGSYTLNGTIGQPEAGTALSSAGYTLSGGFWFSAVAQQRIYLPLVLKNA